MMKHSHRAALYSLVIFPGAGLWAIGEKKRALIFIIPCVIVCILMVANIMHITQEMTQKMVDGLIPFDVINLFLEVRRQIYADPAVRRYLLILIAAWLLSGLSSYFAGKKKELEQ